MNQGMQAAHDVRIVEQFTNQALPFAEAPSHGYGIDMLVAMSDAGPRDAVLDVACGPGLVACALAERAGHVTGIDLTAKMIEEAQRRQARLGLANMTWELGTAAPLPYANDSFDCVVTRYSLHHVLDPQTVFAEMVRVCKPGGTVLVADVAPAADKAGAFDAIERLRDDSHTRALTPEELSGLFSAADFERLRRLEFDLHNGLERQLAQSFPAPGAADEIRRRLRADIGVNATNLNPRKTDGEMQIQFPIMMMAGQKPKREF